MPRRCCDALGSAGTQAAGLWEFNADGAMSKHLHPGKAAFNGVLAADLARAGFTGRGADSGRRPRIFSRHERAPRCLAHHRRARLALEDPRKLLQAAFLLRPHPHRDRRRRLRACGRRRQIAEHPHRNVRAGLRDREGAWIPRTPYQAKFSIAYCVAAALAEGRVGLEQFAAGALRVRMAGHRRRCCGAHA